MAMLKKQVVQGALDFNRTCWKLKRSQQPPPGHPETYRNLAWQVFFAFQSHVTATAIWNGPSFRRYGSLGACRHHVYQFFSCTKGHSKACHSAFSPIVVVEADQKMNNQTVHEICFAPLGKNMWTFWALGSTTTQSKMYNEKTHAFHHGHLSPETRELRWTLQLLGWVKGLHGVANMQVFTSGLPTQICCLF